MMQQMLVFELLVLLVDLVDLIQMEQEDLQVKVDLENLVSLMEEGH